jgi:hypothetical protein
MRRRARDNGRNALGVMLLAIAGLAMLSLAGAAVLLRPPPTDQETLCRLDAQLAAHTIILVDATDRLEPRHRRKLRAVLAQERARLGQYDRLTIMRINVRRPQEPSILFSKCLPRPPEQTNPLFENARLAQQRWDADFGQALDGALRSASASNGARASPVIAGLRAVAADPEFESAIARRRLVLVSDMLEHNPQGFSLYVSDADYSTWTASTPNGPPDLSRVDVRLVPLDRPDHAARQAYALETFWPAFFDAADAQSVSVDPAA